MPSFGVGRTPIFRLRRIAVIFYAVKFRNSKYFTLAANFRLGKRKIYQLATHYFPGFLQFLYPATPVPPLLISAKSAEYPPRLAKSHRSRIATKAISRSANRPKTAPSVK